MVIVPCTIPKLSCSTLATGARQFVVHEAFETTLMLGRIVGLVVDAQHQRVVRIGRRRRNDHLLHRPA